MWDAPASLHWQWVTESWDELGLVFPLSSNIKGWARLRISLFVSQQRLTNKLALPYRAPRAFTSKIENFLQNENSRKNVSRFHKNICCSMLSNRLSANSSFWNFYKLAKSATETRDFSALAFNGEFCFACYNAMYYVTTRRFILE